MIYSEELAAAVRTIKHQANALENCRLVAARHRKEEWAQHVLRFCAEAGVTGSPLRDVSGELAEPIDRAITRERKQG